MPKFTVSQMVTIAWWFGLWHASCSTKQTIRLIKQWSTFLYDEEEYIHI